MDEHSCSIGIRRIHGGLSISGEGSVEFRPCPGSVHMGDGCKFLRCVLNGESTCRDLTCTLIVDEFYAPDHERGIRWNDPAFAIEWPMEPVVISDKDTGHPDFERAMAIQMT